MLNYVDTQGAETTSSSNNISNTTNMSGIVIVNGNSVQFTNADISDVVTTLQATVAINSANVSVELIGSNHPFHKNRWSSSIS